MGKYLPSNRVHRQWVCHPFLPIKNDPSSTLECLRLCPTLQFRDRSCCWIYEHRCRLFSRTEVVPTEKLELAIRNDIHTNAIGMNIQSSGFVKEEQIYVLPDDEIDESLIWEEKQNKE